MTEGPRTLRVFVARDAQGLAGMAVIADAPGKCQPITYLLATDASARIRAVEVLVYREAHGGEVRDERWRKQFAGKGPTDALRLSDDVRNVAGATISCRSLTDAVRRDVQALEVARGELARRAAAADAKPDPAADARERAARTEGTKPTDDRADAPAAAVVRTRLLMGTTLTIEAREGDAARASEAIEAAFDVVAALERALSDWDATSEASRLSTAGGAWIELSEPLSTVLLRARHWQTESGGAFDPCLGAWTRLARVNALPAEPAALDALRATAGPGALELDGTRARLPRAGTRLDLGAIGKGFALDRAASELERRGVHCALLDFGGQLLALDAPLGEPGWPVAVRDPAAPDSTLALAPIARLSLACTADYERGRVVDGRRVSHVLDPRTGRPVEGVLGVLVLHPSATDADALSTAVFVLGAAEGERFARERGLVARVWPSSGASRGTLALPDVDVPRVGFATPGARESR
ncbi:MAG: FAD:protein FMN transferase [Planctomycetes bacterium]|nr:FAD:protein FMN transferase [Planctomycetota bacterium]